MKARTGLGSRLAILVGVALGTSSAAAFGTEPTSPKAMRILDLERVFTARIDQHQAFDRHVEQVIAAYRLDIGMLPAARALDLPSRYPIYPFGGVQDVDICPMRYVDLDPSSPGIQDWDCGPHTYDGHDATDFWLKSFGEQDGGVPVFAPLAGRIIHAQDGYQDRQKQCSPNTENYVLVDHGGGLVTGYGHLRTGSVRVAIGQMIEAGTEVGEVASSGCSYWPHLHFVTRLNDQAVEPHTGACNPGDSGWRRQHPIRNETWLWDLGFTHVDLDDLSDEARPPEPLPRLGRIARKDKRFFVWAYILNLEPQTPFQIRAFDPKGKRRYDSGLITTENEESLRLAVVWQLLKTKKFKRLWGTWTIELSLDGEVVVEAPLDYYKKPKRKRNRSPLALDGVFIEPRDPLANEPLSCVAESDRLLDDPDYDIVRHYFEWRVNGEVVRERTWASRSDVLAANVAQSGDRVGCAVVPLDDHTAGEAAAAEVVIQ